jgi:hypothetical protein
MHAPGKHPRNVPISNAFAALDCYRDTPFYDATEAEIALVRLTIPCVEIKVLKHGGTLSKTHSVCVPNEVTKLRQLPRTAAESGIIYYSKPGRLGSTRKFQVRPSKIKGLCDWLTQNVKAYRGIAVECTSELRREGVDWAADDRPTQLEFPLLVHGDEGTVS